MWNTQTSILIIKHCFKLLLSHKCNRIGNTLYGSGAHPGGREILLGVRQ